jgi:hypothetical protein
MLRIFDEVFLELAWEEECWRFHAWEVFGSAPLVSLCAEDRNRRFGTLDAAWAFFAAEYRRLRWCGTPSRTTEGGGGELWAEGSPIVRSAES